MSELPLPEQDDQNKETTTDRQREANEACDEFFRFRPIAYLRRLVRKADQHNEPQNKAAYYANLACNACGEFCNSVGTKRLVLGALTISVVIGLSLIWMKWLGSNGVVAIFTIVLTYATWFSWQTMRRQNKIMLRQMGQTKDIIEQMRLDNRAWLSIHDIKIKRLQRGYNKLKCTAYVRNSGKTPGRVINGCIRYFVRDKDFPQDSIIYEFESIDDDRPTVYLAPPNETIPWEMSSIGTIDDNTIEAIRVGDKELHILMRLRYRYVGGNVDLEKAFFTSIAAGPDLTRRGNYCAVHKEIGIG